jgi:CRISPR-associated endonuclease/helicase Cas3
MTNQNILIKLEPRSISASTSLPQELNFMRNALQHQVSLFEKARNADIIVDLAPTGTGKTKAALTTLLHQPRKSAIYIAPTNALVEQQTEAAQKFVDSAGLNHVVIPASANNIRKWPNDIVGKRNAEKLRYVLRNPATLFPEVGANRPVVLITNPDIFYYATFFKYNDIDRGNVAKEFFTRFGTIIFDEFHLYDAKQLVGLLFYLAYSHVFGFFQYGRRVVLLTATPEPACETALQSLENQGVRVVIVGNDNHSNLLPSQTEVNLELRPKPERDVLLQEIADQVSKRYLENSSQNGAVILDSKDHINRLASLLKQKGLEGIFGRITGSTPQLERKSAAQKSIILATSTVDVGFNFERNPAPTRQNLDWLIFSARDRAAFWQRIGRVGRVLGKTETDIPSDAIAYLPDAAWEEGLTSLDTLGGRTALKETLESLSCLDKPFLTAYWRSEAFLEIARPLLELEKSLEDLAESKYVTQLFNALKETLGGNRTWDDYRWRMKVLQGAENISKTSLKNLKKQWKFLSGGQAFVKTYIKSYFPKEWDDIKAGRVTLADYESVFLEEDVIIELKEFAEIWTASYAPLFQFRDSLFESLKISDPHGLILDELDETVLDPIHLLRYYEFERSDEIIEVTARAESSYDLSFRMRYHDTRQNFVNTQLNKLTAFKNIQITRQVGGATRPTPLLKELEKKLFPGIIICPITNSFVIYQLTKEGVNSYSIIVECNDATKEYKILPGLSGILAIAMKCKQLRLPDDEHFIV